MKKSDKIRRFLKKGMKPGQIAERLNVKPAYIHTIKWLDRKAASKAKAQPERSHDPKVAKAEKKYIKTVEKLYKKPPTRPSKLMKAIDQMNQEMAAVRELDRQLLAPPTLAYEQRLQSTPTKLIVEPQYKDAAFKLLKEADLVNKPPHYTDGGVDTLKFIEAKDLNFRLGNVVKYVSRCGKKMGVNPIEDLEKARFYLDREIAVRKGA
jgi:hypothetical protein